MRLAPPLKSLILAEDTEIDASDIRELLVAVGPTLESLAIRQAGDITDDTLSCDDFLASELPRLKRLAIALRGEIMMPLKKFRNVNLEILELGSESEGVLEQLCTLLEEEGVWPSLKELAFSSSSVDGETWARIHELCEKRGCSFLPGFTTELDWPVTC